MLSPISFSLRRGAGQGLQRALQDDGLKVIERGKGANDPAYFRAWFDRAVALTRSSHW